MISLKNIKIAVSQKLDALFGEGYEIYTEEVKQGLSPPAFSIQFLDPTKRQMSGNRYYRTHPMDIIFFPLENGQEREQCEEVIEVLYDGLEYITVVGDTCRGSDIHYEVIDNVLHFFVQYNMYVLKSTIYEEYMGDLKHSSFMKG